MATYYYDAQASGLNNGTSKADAFTTFAAAVAAANVDGDIILGNAASQENLGGNAVYTFLANIAVFWINFTTDAITDPYDAGGYIGSNSTARSVSFTGDNGKAVYLSHFSYRTTGNNSSISLGSSTTGFYCEVGVLAAYMNTTGTGALVYLGNGSTSSENGVKIGKIRFRRGHLQQRFMVRAGTVEINGFELIAGGITSTDPALGLFVTAYVGGHVTASNCDFSGLDSGSTIVGNCAHSPGVFIFNNCKLPTSYILLATQNSGVPSAGKVSAFDCAVGDSHVNFHYATAFGEVLVDTGKYANDNICDANLSWKVTTTAKVSRYTPFYLPYVSLRHAGVASVSPWLAVARDGNASAYTDVQIWAEFEAKETSGSVIMTCNADKAADLATPANQATDAATAWTGLNATNWKGKLGEMAFTPAESGFIRGRVAVGAPSVADLYIDPQIRI